MERVLERVADRAGHLLTGGARLRDRRSGVGERIGVGVLAREQLRATHRCRRAGEQLLDGRQARQGAAERAALTDVVRGQLERAESEAGEVTDSGRQPRVLGLGPVVFGDRYGLAELEYAVDIEPLG